MQYITYDSNIKIQLQIDLFTQIMESEYIC